MDWLPPTWAMCLWVFHELRINLCFSQLLYWVVFEVCGLASSLAVELLLNEQVSHWGLPVSAGTTANTGQARGQLAPCTIHLSWMLTTVQVGYPSFSCLRAPWRTAVLLHHWQILRCHQKETKLERTPWPMQQVSNAPCVNTPGGYVPGDLV